MREAQKDNILNNLKIREGTLVGVNHNGNHYSPKYFKNP
jgi:hypothetical protein